MFCFGFLHSFITTFLIDNKTKNSLFCYLHLYNLKNLFCSSAQHVRALFMEEMLSLGKIVHNAAPIRAVANTSEH